MWSTNTSKARVRSCAGGTSLSATPVNRWHPCLGLEGVLDESTMRGLARTVFLKLLEGMSRTQVLAHDTNGGRSASLGIVSWSGQQLAECPCGRRLRWSQKESPEEPRGSFLALIQAAVRAASFCGVTRRVSARLMLGP